MQTQASAAPYIPPDVTRYKGTLRTDLLIDRRYIDRLHLVDDERDHLLLDGVQHVTHLILAHVGEEIRDLTTR